MVEDETLQGLCPHHRQVMRDWHEHWRHEDNDDFIKRVNEYRQQCCQKEGERK